ncbi:hypothetical protein [Caulobacter zeae]|uniref:hypothetical protein n=1 Tax=Caulobacter zeae TaxID=2055137 RepID=UPI00105575C4|nr:hypothetical protein [Caulobacter zeae]
MDIYRVIAGVRRVIVVALEPLPIPLRSKNDVGLSFADILRAARAWVAVSAVFQVLDAAGLLKIFNKNNMKFQCRFSEAARRLVVATLRNPLISENDNVDILVDLPGTFGNVATVTGV